MDKNNNKIMEFLGYKTHKCKDLNTLQWDCPKDTPLEDKIKGRLFLVKLHFQDDWNWIFEVVDYIENIKTDRITKVEFSNRGNSVTVRVDIKGGVGDNFTRSSSPIFTVRDSDRKLLYNKAIIGFIDWFNENSK
jgi:hypothetical protein